MQSLVARPTRSVLLMVTCAVAISSAVSCLGKNTVKADQLSPQGTYKAELIEGDTGAAGGWVSVVRVSKAKPTLAEEILGRGKVTIFRRGCSVATRVNGMAIRHSAGDRMPAV